MAMHASALPYIFLLRLSFECLVSFFKIDENYLSHLYKYFSIWYWSNKVVLDILGPMFFRMTQFSSKFMLKAYLIHITVHCCRRGLLLLGPNRIAMVRKFLKYILDKLLIMRMSSNKGTKGIYLWVDTYCMYVIM